MAALQRMFVKPQFFFYLFIGSHQSFLILFGLLVIEDFILVVKLLINIQFFILFDQHFGLLQSIPSLARIIYGKIIVYISQFCRKTCVLALAVDSAFSAFREL